MRDFRDAKVMARALRAGLTAQGVTITHSTSLELLAKAFGFDNWNILAAKIDAASPTVAAAAGKGEQTLYCSFCGKSQHDVQTLIAGPGTMICDACVTLCNDIIEHNAVLKMLAVDEAAGGEAAGYPKLSAYLGQRSSEQLRAYLAKIEGEVGRARGEVGGIEAEIAARALGAAPPGPLKTRSDEDLAKQLNRANKRIGGSATILDIVARALAARP